MPTLTPVDGDPFSAGNGPTLTPVDGDPFSGRSNFDVLPLYRDKSGLHFDPNVGIVGGVKHALEGFASYLPGGGNTLPINGGLGDANSQEAQSAAGAMFNAAALGAGGGDLMPNSGKTILPKLPSRGVLKDVEQQGYRAIDDAGVLYSPQSVADKLRAATMQQGFPNREAAPRSFGLIKDFADASPSADGLQTVYSPSDLDTLRQDLGDITEGRDAFAAGKIRSAIDDFIENPGDAAVAGDANGVAGLYRTARANSAARQRADELAKLLQSGERRNDSTHSGANEANTIRQKLRSYVDQNNILTGYGEDDYRIPGYTDAQNEAVKQILQGTLLQNAARSTGNVLGKGGGLGRMATAAIGAAAGHAMMGGPEGVLLGAGAPTAISMGARAVDDSYARNGIKGLMDSMIQGSPYYQEQMANAPFKPLAPNAPGIALMRALMAQQGYQPQD